MSKCIYKIISPVRKNKKYSVLKYNPETNEYEYLLSFGQQNYAQYRDKTPLKLYSYLDHNDEKRRQNYYKRHGTTNNIESAKWWSHTFLW